jgi:DNA-binding response OmpR family regulator
MMKKALIVDDEPDLRSELADYLGSSGWSCLQSEVSGAKGKLESDEARGLSIVFIPARRETFRPLAESARLNAPGSLIIAMADLDGKKDLRAAVESGLVDDFLPIPFSPGDVRGIYKLVRDNGI